MFAMHPILPGAAKGVFLSIFVFALTACEAGYYNEDTQQLIGLEELSSQSSKALAQRPKVSGQRGPGDSCPEGRFTLSLEQLQTIMGGSSQCTNCARYHGEIVRAMELYDLNSPKRAAAFLAQVRHETAHLRTLFQPLDNGAGALHMLPQNFPALIRDVPGLQKVFDQELPHWQPGSGKDEEAGRIIQRPEWTFISGGWWFKQGAKQVLGAGQCQDLRPIADQGDHAKISQCIFGFNQDPGRVQRQNYYDLARSTLDNVETLSEAGLATVDGSGVWDGATLVEQPCTLNGQLQCGANQRCEARPGAHQAVTNAHCAACMEGQTYWPCGLDPFICICTGGAPKSFEWRKSSGACNESCQQQESVACFDVSSNLEVDDIHCDESTKPPGLSRSCTGGQCLVAPSTRWEISNQFETCDSSCSQKALIHCVSTTDEALLPEDSCASLAKPHVPSRSCTGGECRPSGQGFYADWSQSECVNDGQNATWDEVFTSKSACCQKQFAWKLAKCLGGSPPPVATGEWKVQGFSACSDSCQKTEQVVCVSEGNADVIADSKCNPDLKPTPNTIACESNQCSPAPSGKSCELRPSFHPAFAAFCGATTQTPCQSGAAATFCEWR